MEIKVKYDGMLIACTVSVEDEVLVVTPIIDLPKQKKERSDHD